MALFFRLKNEISAINKIIKSNVILLNSRALSQIAKKDSNQIEPLKKKPDWLPEDKVTHTGQVSIVLLLFSIFIMIVY